MVSATPLGADRAWVTRAGDELRGKAGDWAVTGPDGSTWTAVDSEFAATYESLGAGKFRRIGTVEARLAHGGEVAHSHEGPVTAEEGGWVVRRSTGFEWVVPREHFEATYGPVD